jgi:hypothetical protein
MNPIKESIIESSLIGIKQNKGKQRTKELSLFNTLFSKLLEHNQINDTENQTKTSKIFKPKEERKEIKTDENLNRIINQESLQLNVLQNQQQMENKKNSKILNDNQQLLPLNKKVSQQLEKDKEMKKIFNDVQESLQLDHNLIKEKKTDRTSKIEQENLQSVKEEKNAKNLNINQLLSLNKNVSQQLNTVESSNKKVNQESLQLNVLQKQEMKKSFNDMQESLQLNPNLTKEKKTEKINDSLENENLKTKLKTNGDNFIIKNQTLLEKTKKEEMNHSQNNNQTIENTVLSNNESVKERFSLVNINENDKISKNIQTDTQNLNTQSNLAVNYDIVSGYNSSKFSSDTQQWQNNGQLQQNPNTASNFQVVYQNTNINATITQNLMNIVINSSDILFTPKIIDGIKNILETSGYKDVKLTLKDKERVYKLNLTENQQPSTKSGINLAV